MLINIFTKKCLLNTLAALTITLCTLTCATYQTKADDKAVNEEVLRGAENFVQSMAKRGIAFLSDPTLTNAQKREAFESLLETSFDIPTIGKYVLGRHWRTASEKDKQEYQKLFRQAILDLYTNRFSEYSGQKVEVVSARKHGKRDYMVKSHIVSEDNTGLKIEVEWRVRYKNGEYKIIDIYVEQVSMAITQRADFSAVIQRGGGKLEVLLAHLEKNN